ncbi:uncharacterized protein [Spinacia oleracea]|uniref:Uncharacterized protein n=1 Tax=Spinacia oleracea TaxID=3562 RepID=A0A9R0I7M2_SPIOL|nr:uncharacterized protein LOC110784188 [Spinacia oleracea]
MFQIGDLLPHSLKLKRPSNRPQGTLELEILARYPYSPGSDSYPTNGSTLQGTGYPYEQPPNYGESASYGDPGYGKPASEEKKKSGNAIETSKKVKEDLDDIEDDDDDDDDVHECGLL